MMSARLDEYHRQSLCMAIIENMSRTSEAVLALTSHLQDSFALTVLTKPAQPFETTQLTLLRIKDVGAIACHGHAAATLAQMQEHQPDGLALGEVLAAIGIPAHHKTIYQLALQSAQVVALITTTSNAARTACALLEDHATQKPILYLGTI